LIESLLKGDYPVFTPRNRRFVEKATDAVPGQPLIEVRDERFVFMVVTQEYLPGRGIALR
jgi:hypothetical protein